MKSVQIITIKNKIPLFKGEEQANSIELLQIEEFGYELVSQKDIYQVGDKAVLIFPDYCLPDIELFSSFVKPNGDYSKSMLGKNNRIRAKKFNLHRGDGLPVYSNGILLKIQEVKSYLDRKLNPNIKFLDKFGNFIEDFDLSKELGITKYEEIENNSGPGVRGGASCKFPDGVVKTDEENFNNLIKHIEKILPKRLILTLKIDGSSFTMWYKDGKYGIASRNQGKSLYTTRVTGRRKKTFLEKILFWTKPDLNIYEKVLNDSDFVKYGMPYLEKLKTYCEKHKINLVAQGELRGQNLKGSGNKNNPHSKLQPDIEFFNICSYNFDQSIRLGENMFIELTDKIGLPRVPQIADRVFNSIEDIKQECEKYFQSNLVEGIVIRDENHAFSCKYMSLNYDAKK